MCLDDSKHLVRCPLQVVVFPRTQLPLHIFEERYKEMVGEAIRDKSEFGIVLAREEGIVNAGCTVVVDDISAGGWKSSYTGEWLSREVMDSYGDNIRAKLAPLLHPDSRVLEIGCASGISLFLVSKPAPGWRHSPQSPKPPRPLRRRPWEEQNCRCAA